MHWTTTAHGEIHGPLCQKMMVIIIKQRYAISNNNIKDDVGNVFEFNLTNKNRREIVCHRIKYTRKRTKNCVIKYFRVRNDLAVVLCASFTIQ